ncbi:hypothetical protein [Hymenobacter sp. B1770]|uniref:hypothetical protein n=1 Tax=Hymenobacter sp. B1770 TaxID=1718788 RepID=UPI003CE6B8DB
MNKTFYTTCLLVAGLIVAGPATAQHQALYQITGQSNNNRYTVPNSKYTVPLTSPLHVLLPVPMNELASQKMFKKAVDHAGYLAEVATKRAALEEAAKHWHLSPVSFVTMAEYEALKYDKQASHLVIEIGTKEIVQENYDGRRHTQVTFNVPSLNLSLLGNTGIISSGALLEKHEPVNSVLLCYQMYYPFSRQFWQEIYPSTEPIAGVQQLQSYIKQRAKGQSHWEVKNSTKENLGKSETLLQGKTLLLAQHQLSKSLTESKLAKVYPYPVKVADKATFDSAITNANSKYLYVRYVTIDSENGYQLLDAGSGEVIGYSGFHATHTYDIGYVQDDDLKQLVKTATKKN